MSYAYDAQDRLSSVTALGGTTATYGYDADGRRITTTVNASSRTSVWVVASTYRATHISILHHQSN